MKTALRFLLPALVLAVGASGATQNTISTANMPEALKKIAARYAVTDKRIAAFRQLGNKCGVATAEMLEFFERFDEQKYGQEGGPLHDPCVIAWMLQPTLFQGRQISVEIELESERTIGMTVADYWHVTKLPRNVMYLRSGDADGFYKLLTERIARLP